MQCKRGRTARIGASLLTLLLPVLVELAAACRRLFGHPFIFLRRVKPPVCIRISPEDFGGEGLLRWTRSNVETSLPPNGKLQWQLCHGA